MRPLTGRPGLCPHGCCHSGGVDSGWIWPLSLSCTHNALSSFCYGMIHQNALSRCCIFHLGFLRFQKSVTQTSLLPKLTSLWHSVTAAQWLKTNTDSDCHTQEFSFSVLPWFPSGNFHTGCQMALSLLSGQYPVYWSAFYCCNGIFSHPTPHCSPLPSISSVLSHPQDPRNTQWPYSSFSMSTGTPN